MVVDTVPSTPPYHPGLEQVLSEEPFGYVLVPGSYPVPWDAAATHVAQRAVRHTLFHTDGAGGAKVVSGAGYCASSTRLNPEQTCIACAMHARKDPRVKSEERWLLTVIDRRPWRVVRGQMAVHRSSTSGTAPDSTGIYARTIGTMVTQVAERGPTPAHSRHPAIPWMRCYLSLPWETLTSVVLATDGTCACGAAWVDGVCSSAQCADPEPATAWNRPVRVCRRGAGSWATWEVALAPHRRAADSGRIRLEGTESGWSASLTGEMDPVLEAVPPLDFRPLWERYALTNPAVRKLTRMRPEEEGAYPTHMLTGTV